MWKCLSLSPDGTLNSSGWVSATLWHGLNAATCDLASLPGVETPWTRSSRWSFRPESRSSAASPGSRPHTCSPRTCWLQEGGGGASTRGQCWQHIMALKSVFVFVCCVPCKHFWISHACFWHGSFCGMPERKRISFRKLCTGDKQTHIELKTHSAPPLSFQGI